MFSLWEKPLMQMKKVRSPACPHTNRLEYVEKKKQTFENYRLKYHPQSGVLELENNIQYQIGLVKTF
jgi:hypothetical protein